MAGGKDEAPGSLPKEHIRTVIRKNLHEVRWCYEKGSGVWPGVEGRLSVKFIIAPDGAVAAASVANSELAEELGCCVTERMKTWHFDAPDGGGIVFVTYPFLFKYAEPDAPGEPAPSPAD